MRALLGAQGPPWKGEERLSSDGFTGRDDEERRGATRTTGTGLVDDARTSSCATLRLTATAAAAAVAAAVVAAAVEDEEEEEEEEVTMAMVTAMAAARARGRCSLRGMEGPAE
jgi:hypothetical protein